MDMHVWQKEGAGKSGLKGGKGEADPLKCRLFITNTNDSS